MGKPKTYTVSVVVYEWDDEEREDLPVDTPVDIEYTKRDLEDYDDLDDLVGDKLEDRYGATPYDYLVL